MNIPSFSDFIVAAQKLPDPEGEIICQDGIVTDISKIGDSSNLFEVRRKTWQAFCKALSKRFSKNQINNICDRYGYFSSRDLYWEKMQTSSSPLRRCHVEYFGVGADAVNIYSLNQYLKNQFVNFFKRKTIYECTNEEIRNFVNQSQRQSFLGDSIDPRDIKGGPQSVAEHFKKDFFPKDQNFCRLLSGVGNLLSNDPRIPKFHPYYMRLVMAIISKLETDEAHKDIGFLIPAPGDVLGQESYYVVYDIISHGGLTAVALTPVSDSSSLPPLLLFRCTQQILSATDSIPSILNDMEEDIGQSGYHHSKEKLDALMQDPKFTHNGKIKVLSYSLGGAHEINFLNDHWQEVDECIACNCVGGNDTIIENIARQINQLPSYRIPPRFYIYRNAGDWVNKSGKKHLGWGINHPLGIVQVTEFNIDDYPKPSENVYDPFQWGIWLDLHAVRPLDSKSYYEYKVYRGPTICNPILDTYKQDSKIEDARLILGNIFLKNIIVLFWSVFDFALRILGIEFFRRNSFLKTKNSEK